LELGGKNAQIVMEDADLELALEGALWGAFGTTGQRCTATSRLLLHRDIKAEFTSKLIEQTSKLRLGAGADIQTQVGPLVNSSQLERVKHYIEVAFSEGAKLLIGGKAPTGEKFEHGYFFLPTILDTVTATMRIAREELIPLKKRSLFSTIQIMVYLRQFIPEMSIVLLWQCEILKQELPILMALQLGLKYIFLLEGLNRQATVIAKLVVQL
jgi:Aldehyde dehydrogenase family